MGQEMKTKRTIRGGIILVLAVIAMPVYIFCDVRFHGPQVVRFNQRCNKIVQDLNLIGQSPETIKAALGKPTSVYTYDKVGSFTLNYAPHPSFPFAKFQAHFTDGILTSTEMFDD